MLKKWLIRFVLFFIAVVAISALYIYVQKEEIKTKALNTINKELNAKVSVEGLIEITFFKTFPNVTLALNKVFIEDKFKKNKPFAELEKINFTINPFSLLGTEIKIHSIILKNGKINLKTFKDGSSNYNILKKKGNRKTSSLNLEKIVAENIFLIYDDLKNSVYLNTYIENVIFAGKFYNKNFELNIDLISKTENLKIGSTNFLNQNKLKATFDLFYKAKNSCITFKNNNINIDGNNFVVLGDICSGLNSIQINAKAKGSKLENALSLIPKDLFKLDDITGTGEYTVDVDIKGKLNKPKIYLEFFLKNATAKIKNIDFPITHLFTTGSFSNMPVNNLKIKEFSLKSNKTFLKGNMHIPNLKEKRMELKIDGKIYANSLQQLNVEQFEFQQGEIDLENIFFNFNYRNKDSIWMASKLLGNLEFSNLKGNLNKINQKFIFDGKLSFVKRKINVKELKLKIGENDIKFSGTLNNALNFFQDNIFGTNDALIIRGNLNSKLFNINDFLEGSKNKSKTNAPFDLLKWLNIESNVTIEIDKLVYKKLVLQNIYSTIKSEKAGVFSFKNFKGKAVEGFANGNIELRFFNNQTLEVFIDAKIKNIQIKKLFTSFENFGQKTITDKNLKGILDADIDLSMTFKNFIEFKRKSLLLQTNFELSEGELINLESLKSLSNYLSMEQLEHLYFRNYSSSISIANEVINLKNSKIQSNLLSLELGGTHSFNNDINYAFKLNFKNLLASKFKKKKTLNSDYINDEEGGIDIFLSMKGTVSNPIIKMDKQSAHKKLQEDLKKEKENLKNLFNKDTEFFEDKNELYLDDEEFIEFD